MALVKLPPPPAGRIVTDRWTAPFWDAVADRRLVVAQCADCGTARMPPTPFCPTCRSQRIDWTPLSGGGEIYSYTIVVRAIVPGMEAFLPYVPAVIALDGGGGTRLISNIAGCDVDAIAVGMRVMLRWRDDGASPFPYFVLDEAPPGATRLKP